MLDVRRPSKADDQWQTSASSSKVPSLTATGSSASSGGAAWPRCTSPRPQARPPGRSEGRCIPSWPPRSARNASSAKSGPPPACSTRTSCRSSTPAKRPASSGTRCRTSRARSLRDRLAARGVNCRSTTRCRSPARWRTPSATRTPRASCIGTSSRRTSCSAEGHALVADFGIARALQVADAEHLTATGLAVGTPAYMSPEQADGAIERGRPVGPLQPRLRAVRDADRRGRRYTGRTPQAMIAKRLLEPLPHVRTLRASVPQRRRAGDSAGTRRDPGRPICHRRRVRPGAGPTTPCPRR